MKPTLLLILMAITVGYCVKNKTDWSDWRKVFERGEGSSRPSKLRRTSATTQQPANPIPVYPRPINPRPVNPRPVNPRPVNPPPFNQYPVNPRPVNPPPFNQYPVNPPPFNQYPVNPPSFNQYPGISECDCGWENVAKQARIVGGEETIPHRYPWAAFVYYNHQGNFGAYGASIITNRHLLTTVKAVRGIPVNVLFVYVGVHNIKNIYETSQDISVERTVMHPGFINGNASHPVPNYDIAIIITKTIIKFGTAAVGPVCMPMSKINWKGTPLKALGWGATSQNTTEGVLRELDVTVILNTKCRSQYRFQIYDSHICAEGPNSGTCTGDEGGGLFYQSAINGRFTQVGIISYNAPDCISKPTVSTDVNTFIQWISDVIVGSQKGVTACYGI